MGTRGPVPKRAEELIGRTHSVGEKAARLDAQVQVTGPVPIPPAQEFWHPLAQRWYKSLADSGQSRFFEPSDWETARIAAHVLSQYLGTVDEPAIPVPKLLENFMRINTLLLATEADRRRVRLEVARTRGESEAGGAAHVSQLDTYRHRLRGGTAG